MAINHEHLSRAVMVLRNAPEADDEEVFHRLVQEQIEGPLAARLVEFLPIAYCRVIFGSLGVHFPQVFLRRVPGSETIEEDYSKNAIWSAVLEFASAEAAQQVGGRALMLVAGRSAEFQAANAMLNRGTDLKNLTFTPTVLTWPENGPS